MTRAIIRANAHLTDLAWGEEAEVDLDDRIRRLARPGTDLVTIVEIVDEVRPHFAAMSVAELRVELRDRGLPVSGAKADLVARLEGHSRGTTPGQDAAAESAPPGPPPPAPAENGPVSVPPTADPGDRGSQALSTRFPRSEG